MKRAILTVAIAALGSPNVYAQSSLNDQINAVSAVQDQNEAAQEAAQQQQARRWEEQQKAAQAVAAQRQAAARAYQQQKEAEALAEKKRDQDYQDKLRDLDIQAKTLDVAAEKARVARSNEYIDEELKEKAAQTDVIKSKADSTRDISEGTKTLLEKTGDAEVAKESGIFGK